LAPGAGGQLNKDGGMVQLYRLFKRTWSYVILNRSLLLYGPNAAPHHTLLGKSLFDTEEHFQPKAALGGPYLNLNTTILNAMRIPMKPHRIPVLKRLNF
jgi:hypothetical protein